MAYGVPLAEATAITILDWVISVLSIIVFGAVVYVVSPMPRGMGRIPQPPRRPPPGDRLHGLPRGAYREIRASIRRQRSDPAS